jgi:hypothetical protein
MHLVHELEIDAILAERERQARAVLRASKLKGGHGSRARPAGRAARKEMRGKQMISANESRPARLQRSAGPDPAPRLQPSERGPPHLMAP